MIKFNRCLIETNRANSCLDLTILLSHLLHLQLYNVVEALFQMGLDSSRVARLKIMVMIKGVDHNSK